MPSSAESIRAVFLDVDGTYADYGLVPEAHVQAVRAARKAGHRVFICTGRPLSMLSQEILAAGFDGVVASAGAYVEVDGSVLVDRCFPVDLAARTVEALDAHDAVYILESQSVLHTSPAAVGRLKEILSAHFRQAPGSPAGVTAILGSITQTVDRAAVRFAKVSVFSSPVALGCLVEEIGEDVAAISNSIADEGQHAGELYHRGLSKADGIAAVIAHLGIPRENTIAIGDGENDVEMIAYAGVGVAIEGAPAEVLAVADRTAAGPRQQGLVAAFAELGIV
ncbi:HAD-IIB family hydrolase [Paenarthrobacter sp. CM16]|uniref:HAD-IIB family hydrolase n=1 Tax=Paenarthrobacter sp. CM16 TaxID=2738447 RepID=UPI0015541315|nr:HAD-IIB family hydrolase [Paenarthrobacter sp. CM16]NQD87799.1 HAD-IIB family hydrolase [Paenarthrobacter sp. CM16]